MLDIKKIRREPEQIKAELRKRNLALDSVIDNLCQLDREYRETLKRMERLRVEHKALSKSFYGSGDEGNPAVEAAEPTECGEKEAALGRIKELGATIKDVEKQQQALEWETTNILAALPNLPHKMMTEEEQIEDFFLEPPHYDYPVKGGEEVLERLGLLLHFPARQARGYRGAGARLMAALYSYCSRFLRSNGYEDVFLPPFREGSPLLIGSADRIFPSWELPAKSFCFSPAGVEHGAPGKDQALPTFQALCCVEEQDQTREYAALLYCVRKLFEELSLSGRVRRPALPQMADEMAQECQLELWLPSSAHYLSAARIGDAGDYLARRHKMRVRGGNKEIRFVHTVHLTINLERLLLALAEQKQSDDGSIHLPPPLWDLMGDSRINGF